MFGTTRTSKESKGSATRCGIKNGDSYRINSTSEKSYEGPVILCGSYESWQSTITSAV